MAAPFFLSQASSAMGGIRGVGGIKIEKPGMGGVTRSVTIAIGEIGGGATTCVLLAAGRLCKLPDRGIRNSAGGWKRRILWDGAPRRGRAGVVEDPVEDAALADVVADVVGSKDGDAASFVDGHARAIDATAITGMRQLIHPSTKVGVIHGR